MFSFFCYFAQMKSEVFIVSDNPQFIRTSKAIIRALISLLQKKPFEKITVQDILDETPVTRATFYAHYRDKYEIAEKMLEQFIAARGRLRKTLASPSQNLPETLHQDFWIDRDYAQALLNIHTEHVDFRKTIASELEKEYLADSTSPTRETEAKIYAQANVELYLALMDAQSPDYSPEDVQQIFVSVALHLLDLGNDPDARRYLNDRIAKKHGKAWN